MKKGRHKMKRSSRNRITLMLVGFVAAIVLGGIEHTKGATITVAPGGAYDVDTIQAGIDVANNGDTVLVAPGEYVITVPITFGGKSIIVKSEAGPDETTIRMGTPADTKRGSVVVFENNETAASILDGFTITGGRGIFAPSGGIWAGGGIYFDASSGTVKNCAIVQNSASYGGGVICSSNSLVTVNSCTIAGNSATGSGGGVFSVFNSSVTMTDCIVSSNSVTGATMGVAGYGGGVSCAESSIVTLTNCRIADNSAGMGGGGLYFVKTNAASTMTNCIIIGNSAGNWGAGVGCELTETPLAVTNCVIAHNTAGEGIGGVACTLGVGATISNCTIWGNSGGSTWGASGLGCWKGSATVTNSIIWANTSPKGRDISVEDSVSTLTIAYSDVAGGRASIHIDGGTLNWGEGNIEADPYFADPSYDDFHLKSQAGQWSPNSQLWIQDNVTSPCIDTGNPMSPIGLEPFPNGGFVNMGAYGGTSESSKSYFGEPICGTIVAGDINGDCQVNRIDLEILALHWTDDEPLFP
jgi:hypothetical protein